jgi:hypothetical protein
LSVLRGHRWSSWAAYAGYAPVPEWLTCQVLWKRAGADGKDAKADYRGYIEDYLRQGIKEGAFERLTQALAIGSSAFVEKLRRQIPARAGEGTNAREWRRLLPLSEVVRAVEVVKGELWKDFAGRRGDWGRDLALHIGRMMCGLTLRELGEHAGMNALAVSKAVTRLGSRLKTDKELQQAARQVCRKLNG